MMSCNSSQVINAADKCHNANSNFRNYFTYLLVIFVTNVKDFGLNAFHGGGFSIQPLHFMLNSVLNTEVFFKFMHNNHSITSLKMYYVFQSYEII